MKKKLVGSLLILFFLVGKVTIAQQSTISAGESIEDLSAVDIKKTIQIIFLDADQNKAFALTTDLIKKIAPYIILR